MAGVSLVDLINGKEGQNLTGLIPLDAEVKFISGLVGYPLAVDQADSGWTDGPALMQRKQSKEAEERCRLWESVHGKDLPLHLVLSDFAEDARDSEWFLHHSGRLIHTRPNPILLGKQVTRVVYLQLDLSGWMKQQSKGVLKKICERSGMDGPTFRRRLGGYIGKPLRD